MSNFYGTWMYKVRNNKAEFSVHFLEDGTCVFRIDNQEQWTKPYKFVNSKTVQIEGAAKCVLGQEQNTIMVAEYKATKQ